MVVYWEYAFLENCLLDGLLLYLSLKIARGKVDPRRLVFSSLVGATEAILFPLIPFPVWAAYLVKFLGGALLVVLAVKRGTAKTYAIVSAAFFALTFALGGLLTAAYSFLQVDYAEGQGYLVESAPVGLVLALSAVFAVVTVWGIRALYRFRSVQKHVFSCELEAGGKFVHWKGFLDSGNLLEFRGEPVSLISAVAALALFGADAKPAGRMTVRTVSGEKEAPVFVCDRLKINCGAKQKILKNAHFTVGDVRSKAYTILLHSDIMEGRYESSDHVESMAQ